MIQLFDLTQLVTDFTRITPSTATIIDHIYTSNPENVVECFVPSYAVSDHFPVCFTRKINGKISKTEYTTTTRKNIDVLGSLINLHFSAIWNLIWSRSLYITGM